MPLPIHVTPKAEADFIEIWLYTFEEWGAEQADQCIDQLEAGISHLVAHPFLGTDYSHIQPGYRKFRIERHDVYYRVLDSEMLILRVLHQDMDALRRLR